MALSKQNLNEIISAFQEIDWARRARRQYIQGAKAKYSAPSVSSAAKLCRCEPPHEADVHRFAREYATDLIQKGESISYETALAETRKYLAHGGRLPAHYAIERGIAEVSTGIQQLEAGRASSHYAREMRDKIVQYAAETPALSYAEAAKACGYAVAGPVPRITGKGG